MNSVKRTARKHYLGKVYDQKTVALLSDNRTFGHRREFESHGGKIDTETLRQKRSGKISTFLHRLKNLVVPQQRATNRGKAR